MTEEQMPGLVPALRSHLNSFGSYLGGGAVRTHVATYCRGLFSDLPRKSVGPMALPPSHWPGVECGDDLPTRNCRHLPGSHAVPLDRGMHVAAAIDPGEGHGCANLPA